MDFGQVLTAMVTPFDEQMKLDLEKARKLVPYLIENGSDGLVVGGTTGESPTLTKDEKLELFAKAVAVAKGRGKIMAGTGSNNTFDSIEFTKKAEKTGVDGCLLVTPYYNKPPQEGVYRHFSEIAKNTGLEAMVYNVPGRTGTVIEPETMAKLTEISNITSLKDAGGNLDKTSETKRLSPHLEIYSGDDSLTLPMLAVGGVGVVSVASQVIGKEINQMITAFLNNDSKKAMELHLKCFPIFKGLFITSNPIPVKGALNLMGINVGGVRSPLVELTDNQRQWLTALLVSHGINGVK
jgi:4-hydroxy-tetrahydrodipicolinate synthase